MEERWEMQWQQFLKTLEGVQPGEVQPGEVQPGDGKSQTSEASPWEDPKVFLASFEQVAHACRWPRGEWVAHLLPALCGEAKEAFQKLEIRERDNYEKVKDAILKGEAVKTEAQRQRFRQFCCQEVGDPQIVYKQIKELCHQWLKPERHTKEQVLELLILEQFLASLPPELRSWIQPRRPDTCSQAVALVEDFLRSQQGTRSEARQEPPKEGPTNSKRAEKEPLVTMKRENAKKEPLEAVKRKNAEKEPLVVVKTENTEEEHLEAVKTENIEVEISMPAAGPRIESPDPPSSSPPSEMVQTPLKEEVTDPKERDACLPAAGVKSVQPVPGRMEEDLQLQQRNVGSSMQKESDSTTEPPLKKLKPAPNRKYSEDYLKFGFYFMEENDQQIPVCVICNQVLSKHSMKPSLLQRHFTTKHKEHTVKPIEFFVKKRDEFIKQRATSVLSTNISKKCLEASYELSLIAAKQNKPHTIFEEVVVPSAIEIASILFDEKMADAIRNIPCSDNTVQRRIQDMATDVIQQVVEKITAAEKFAFQLDESTDIAGNAQLIVFVRVPDSDNILEHILFCRPLPGKTTGEEIFTMIDNFFNKHGILWTWCVAICSDGAAALTGRASDVIAQAKTRNSSIVSNHCILHRHVLASKQMSPVFHEILEDATKIINCIKSRPLNGRLFRQLCKDLDSEHSTLLFHIEARWLSKGETLSRLFELRDETHQFLANISSPLAEKFENVSWVSCLAYLADIFKKLNELNQSLQGHGHNVFVMEDKVCAFYKKISLWIGQVQKGNVASFPSVSDFIELNSAADTEDIKTAIKNHLDNLHTEFALYFPFVSRGCDTGIHWVASPFIMDNVVNADLSSPEQEALMEVISNRSLKELFNEKTLTEFWSQVAKRYPKVGGKAIAALLPFCSTYLCEKVFSSLKCIRTKERNCLQLESDLVLSVSTLQPRVQRIMSEKQAQVSH
ncbi:zinc finger BED domain-containing protein 5-like isoform X2 [Crotalus tigris]|uniref:zinc finger BED domain-containing protein 5-like isoform X2 n=1 Tax=Crotalus tigris TaxID=88082 RepID=UPI00192F7A6A|nr:zinc finger BED domain-containing protein 5-like isoform X2 [Crotalus tigris]